MAEQSCSMDIDSGLVQQSASQSAAAFEFLHAGGHTGELSQTADALDTFVVTDSQQSVEAKKRGRPSKAESFRRQRSNSLVSIQDLLTRKRKGEEEEDLYHMALNNSFDVSNPLKKNNSQGQPELVQETRPPAVNTLEGDTSQDILSAIQSMQRENKLFAIQQAKLFREEAIKRDLEWKNFVQGFEDRVKIIEDKISALIVRDTSQNLERRVSELENSSATALSTQSVTLDKRVENLERLLRKNNIVIAGLEPDNRALLPCVSGFLNTRFNVENCIEDVFWLNKNRSKILVKLKDATAKNAIMSKRNLLAGSKIYIDHDVSREERNISYNLRKAAREYREKGKAVSIGIGKITVEGEAFVWDRHTGSLKPMPNRNIRKDTNISRDTGNSQITSHEHPKSLVTELNTQLMSPGTDAVSKNY